MPHRDDSTRPNRRIVEPVEPVPFADNVRPILKLVAVEPWSPVTRRRLRSPLLAERDEELLDRHSRLGIDPLDWHEVELEADALDGRVRCEVLDAREVLDDGIVISGSIIDLDILKFGEQAIDVSQDGMDLDLVAFLDGFRGGRGSEERSIEATRLGSHRVSPRAFLPLRATSHLEDVLEPLADAQDPGELGVLVRTTQDLEPDFCGHLRALRAGHDDVAADRAAVSIHLDCGRGALTSC